ncbi:uncharacterized protein N7506_008511 [Penicillium brevicompactum]|uniref:uncharacterized protein n=1 Tax=Penicillium brevicompactum TaxID=5074 RepID=UPI00253F76DF|nr:uncharacterized protein N7506_008511 [Penicillium brevicompactum]KAJ5325409.1 hypothetical protein N7506_008511 [Penicillium brevicompactum]
MFKNRPNSKKPDKNLINQFHESFSDVIRPVTKHHSATFVSLHIFAPFAHSSLWYLGDLQFTPFRDDHLLPTHTAPHSFHDNTSRGMTPVSHGPAGDLHTPTLGRHSLTPFTLLDQFPVTPLHLPKADISNNSFDPQHFPQEPQNAAFPPSAFVHSTFADELIGEPGAQNYSNDVGIQGQSISQLVSPRANLSGNEIATAHDTSKFRYHVALNTPTAMVHDPNDPPITYLNKGQTYSLSITDLKPPPLANGLIKYRTSIHVSFEDKDQASRPNFCWQLWKDIRGQESHRKDGLLRAVELVDLDPGINRRTQLERTSLDGFSIIWYADPTAQVSGCSIGVKFNFLSTDFSRDAELRFCLVKLFRDHGAERKMFTDVSQLKRAIEKRQKQAAENEKLDSNDSLGKRKRDGRSAVDRRGPNLDAEVLRMQSLFSSNHPVSTFCLPGEKKDDPDLFPIHIVDETQTHDQVDNPTLQTITPPSTSSSRSRSQTDNSGDQQPREQPLKSEPPELISCKDNSGIPMLSNQNAESVDVKSRPTAAVACFYLRFHQSNAQQDSYHTAVYLAERTAQELMVKICEKRQISQTHRVQLFQIRPNGMKVIIDDEAVQRIPDGQDMTAEIGEVPDVAIDGSSVPATVEVSLFF